MGTDDGAGVRRDGRPGALVAPASAGAAAETGMVTAELAVALPALVLVALVVLAGLQVAMTQLRCRDAAAVAARLAARGESAAAVSAAMSSTAPSGGRWLLRRDGELVRAQVIAVVPLPAVGRLLPAFTVTATVAAVDDAVVAP